MLRVKCNENYKNGRVLDFIMVPGKIYEVTPQQYQRILSDNPHAVSSPLPSEEFLEKQGIKRVVIGGEPEAVPEPEQEPPLTRSEVINAFGEDIGRILIDAGHSSISLVEVLIEEGTLEDVPGIGSARAKAIYQYFADQE